MADSLKDLYKSIYPLKRNLRSGWVDRDLDSDTMSSHMHSAMVIGWVLAVEEGVDRQKVIEMLLIHDLVMAEVEDVTPHSGKYGGKRDLEEKVKTKLKKKLPADLAKIYVDLFKEFNDRKTKESIVAREADKLETLFQAEAFEEETGRDDVVPTFLEFYKAIFRTKSGKKYYNNLKIRSNERINGK